MKHTFCVACHGRGVLHHHHLVPKAEGGSDDETNLITLCEACHGRVHGRTFKHHRKLQAVGIAKAAAEGKYKGRPEDFGLHGVIAEGLRAGDSWSAIQREVGCSRATIAKIAKRISAHDAAQLAA
jgi:HNH endonuclease